MKIVRISAMWCPSCILMNRFWFSLKEEFPKLEFVDYDLDLNEEEVKKYEVGKILPVVIAEEEKEVSRLVGEKSKEEVLEFLKQMEAKVQ